MSEKRYVATIQFYVWADDDQQAKAFTEDICQELNDKNDCRAEITELGEQPFATIHYREIIKPC